MGAYSEQMYLYNEMQKQSFLWLLGGPKPEYMERLTQAGHCLSVTRCGILTIETQNEEVKCIV